MTLSPMIRMDGDPVDEGTARPLGADQDADRVGARERDHAAAAPDLKVADPSLEPRRRDRRFVRAVRRPAAVQRVDQQRDVVRAAESICGHGVIGVQVAGYRLQSAADIGRRARRSLQPVAFSLRRLCRDGRSARSHLVEVAASRRLRSVLSGRARGRFRRTGRYPRCCGGSGAHAR
jgi:hypothetical protein